MRLYGGLKALRIRAGMNAPFSSAPPKVTLVKGFGSDAYDNAIATARTCYNSRIITAEDVRKDDKAKALRDRIAQ